MKGNKKNRYSRRMRRMCFIIDKKQLDSQSSIIGGSNFVSALKKKKKKKKKKILQILPEKGSSKTHYFISKHDCYFESLGYVMGKWAVLVAGALRLYVILKFCFIKSQIIKYCVLQTNLYQTGAQFPVLCLKRLTTRLLKCPFLKRLLL